MNKKTNFLKFNFSTILGFFWFLIFYKTAKLSAGLIPDKFMATGIITGSIIFIIGIISAFLINKHKQGFITGFLLAFILGIIIYFLFQNI